MVKMLAGCRTLDLCKVKTSDLRPDGLVLSSEVTKTREARTVELPADVMASLRAVAGPVWLWERASTECVRYRPSPKVIARGEATYRPVIVALDNPKFIPGVQRVESGRSPLETSRPCGRAPSPSLRRPPRTLTRPPARWASTPRRPATTWTRPKRSTAGRSCGRRPTCCGAGVRARTPRVRAKPEHSVAIVWPVRGSVGNRPLTRIAARSCPCGDCFSAPFRT